MKRSDFFLAMSLVGVLSSTFAGTASATCSKCVTDIGGADCVSEPHSGSKCQVTFANSECMWKVDGEAELNFGALKIGGGGNIKGRGTVTCTYRKECKAVASCAPPMTCSPFNITQCISQYIALTQLPNNLSTSSTHSAVYSSVDGTTAQWIADAYKGFAP